MRPAERWSETWQQLFKEIGAFGVVGVICFLVDLTLFQLLYTVVELDAVLAKLLSTVVSMSLAFLGHRFWSFSHRARTGLGGESLRFFAVNAATLALSLAIVWFVRYPLGQQDVLVLQLTNIASIALGTLVRWLTYRIWVFPVQERPGSYSATP